MVKAIGSKHQRNSQREKESYSLSKHLKYFSITMLWSLDGLQKSVIKTYQQLVTKMTKAKTRKTIWASN